MKTLPKTLPLVIAVCVLPLLSPLARAQQQQSQADRYEEPKRFPVVRNVFRQIRSDVRYHFGALRETASGIGHEVKSTIRGERPPRGAAQNQYGYRSVPVPPGPYSPTGRCADAYEEPSPPRYPAGQQQPLPGRAEPRIVAPENLPRPDQAPVHTPTGSRSSQDPLTEVPELERLPDTETGSGSGTGTDPEPAPKPSSQAESSPDPQPNPEAKPDAKPKPVIGKVEYPEAKRSDRAGFHYSPYAPYELLDTRGIEPGALAKDPGNGNIFRLPK